MALDGLGLKDFRMFLLAQDKLDQGETGGGGLEIAVRSPWIDLGDPLWRCDHRSRKRDCSMK